MTGEKLDFGNGKYIPCEIIELSNPISIGSQTNGANDSVPTDKSSDSKEIPHNSTSNAERTVPNRVQQPKPPIRQSPIKAAKKAESLGSRIAGGWRRFEYAHPIAAGILKSVGIVALMEGGNRLVQRISSSHPSSSSTQNRNAPTQTAHRRYDNYSPSTAEPHSVPTDSSVESSPLQIDYPPERSSPKGHEVSGHYQRYGKDKKPKWVDPYPRGGKKPDGNE